MRPLVSLAFDHVWQASLFALAVALWLRVAGSAPARLRHALCLAAALKLLVPSSALFLLGATALRLFASPPRVEGARAWVALANPSAGEWPALSAGVAAALLVAWAAGAAGAALELRRQQRRFDLALRGAPLPADPRVAPLVAEACAALGVSQPVTVAGGPHAVVAVRGVRRPMLLLPATLLRRLRDEELRCLLLHELAHVRRRDALSAHLHALACCLFWFHPLAWWLERRGREAREEACDDEVLALAGERRDYAACLLKLARLGIEPAGPLPAAASGLAARLRRILQPSRPQSGWSYAGAALLALLLLALTALASPCQGAG